MGVAGPMARNVSDLAMLLSVLAGFDPRAPLSMDDDASIFQRRRLEREFKGTRIAWVGDFKGYTPCEPELIEVCKSALKAFESIGCVVEEAVPDYPLDAVWRAVMKLRAWQAGSGLLAFYNDPAKRALLKPEVIYEVESGLKLSAYDVTAASVVRTEWYKAVRAFSSGTTISSPRPRKCFRSTSTCVGRRRSRAGNGDVSRMDEGHAPHHHVRRSGIGGARGLQQSGPADRHPDRRSEPR